LPQPRGTTVEGWFYRSSAINDAASGAIGADGAIVDLTPDLGGDRRRDRVRGSVVELHPPAGTELTPQELQIARLLAGGRTTRETAAAVFLSAKTVEYHLRHVYQKLGIPSGEELARALPRDPVTTETVIGDGPASPPSA
jgi:DNA-binding CsgD family transcriptional regulator